MTSPVQAIERLANRRLRAYVDRSRMESLGDFIAAVELSLLWCDLAKSLDLPQTDLVLIQDICLGCDQCLFEVILRSRNRGRSWGEIRAAVTSLNSRCTGMFEAYRTDFDRMRQSLENIGLLFFPNCNTCYDDWWLQRKEFYLGPSLCNIQVREDDLPEILIAINEHCPTKWREIGRRFFISEGQLEKIYVDEFGSENKLCATLSACIRNKDITWQDLIDALNTIRFSYESLTDNSLHEQKHEMLKQKHAALRGLRGILKVADDVSDDDLMVCFGTHIRAANLRTEQVEEVVTTLELLEDCMGQYSKTIRRWAVNLQKDLESARTVLMRLTDRKQELKRLQAELEGNQSSSGNSWTDISNKLKYVNVELEEIIKELDRANADHRAISDKLNECQIELETSIRECELIPHVIESCKRYTMENALELANSVASNVAEFGISSGYAAGSYVGRAVGGRTGAAVGAAVGGVFGLLLTGHVGFFCGMVGFVAGTVKVGYHKISRGALPTRDERLQRMTDSSVKQLKESKEELDTIRKILNRTKHI